MIEIVLVLSAAYAFIMIAYLRGWSLLPQFEIASDFTPTEGISVVIAARNEASCIDDCLRSILANTSASADRVEVIVVNDHSTDETAEIIERMSGESAAVGGPMIRLLNNEAIPAGHSPKKTALALGIANARYEMIACTDADCIVPPRWLEALAAARQRTGAQVILGPVFMTGPERLLPGFVRLDMLGMMGVTGGGLALGWHRMANGASFAFDKNLFYAVGGWSGNERIVSGDDVFLAQKMAKNAPESFVFLKNADLVVYTPAPATWGAWVRQRLRWGGKNAALPEWQIKTVLLGVWAFSLALVIATLMAPFSAESAWAALIGWSVKAVFDGIWLGRLSRYFQHKGWMRWFWPSLFLHGAYIALIGLAGMLVKRVTWKGRIIH